MGAVMALVWDPRLAAFALFGPAMALGNWAEDRRRSRKARRTGRTFEEEERAAFQIALDEAAANETARLNASLPDPATLVAIARESSPDLWSRRPQHADFGQLRLGTATRPWSPPLDGSAPDGTSTTALLPAAALGATILPGHVTGIAGDRATARAVARSLVVQAAIAHGPADFRIAVLTNAGAADEWAWTKWLPHTEAEGLDSGTRLLGSDKSEAEVVVEACYRAATATLVIVDDDDLVAGRPAPVRDLLASGIQTGVAGIVISETADRLPACCTTIVELDGCDGTARVVEPATGAATAAVLVAGMAKDVARDIATALSPRTDPEAGVSGGALPTSVDLLPLLGLTDPASAAVAARWRAGDPTRPLAVLGLTERGPLTIDLVGDGPHALVGGTTGSGKSELLRTLVASLAAATNPDQLTFVLIDYKGGSAFDACARLPHVVGVVTDLDDRLAERALRCLEAELRYREGVLRAAGVNDLTAYQLASATTSALPRLVVVIDEFATLASELPEFIDALVGIAQRGRSLGVHLILATQRPAGAVKDNIRANTNLRIALRMHDASDSTDVVGIPVAANIGRRQAGRGFVRLGPSEVVPFQAAHVSGRGREDRVTLRPFAFGPGTRAHDPIVAKTPSGPPGLSDLDRLVDAVVEAAGAIGCAPARRPWPDPLPAVLALASLEGDDARLASGAPRAPVALIGRADDPDHQAQRGYSWDTARGNLLLYGVAGSGTTTALLTIATALAREAAADDLHVYALDFGSGGLQPLVSLPHTGAVVAAAEHERQVRLMRMLSVELERRRAQVARGNSTRGAGDPALLVLLDNWRGFQTAFDDMDGLRLRDDFARIVADGPALGMRTVITADQPNAIPLAVAGLVSQRLIFRLADRHDYSTFGLSGRSATDLCPGRCFDAASGLEVHIALPDFTSTNRRPPTTTPPFTVGVLPTAVTLDRLIAPASKRAADDDTWRIAVGVGGESLTTVELAFVPADHALIAGPARSGRSSALLTIVHSARASRPDVAITAVALRRSPLTTANVNRVVTSAVDIPTALAAIDDDMRPQLILIDDAEGVDDAGLVLSGLLQRHRADLHVVAAGRIDAIKGQYGHWTRELRRSRLGIALQPAPDDGDLWNTSFPRRATVPALPGRGYLVVDGQAEPLQVAR